MLRKFPAKDSVHPPQRRDIIYIYYLCICRVYNGQAFSGTHRARWHMNIAPNKAKPLKLIRRGYIKSNYF